MKEIEELNEFCAHSMIGVLGIVFTGFSSDSIQATMPVNRNSMQPNGFLHGGASLALAESLAGAGSSLLIDREQFYAFGLQVSGNHVSSVSEGMLFADAQLIHKGKTTHIWEVKIKDGNDKLISVVRVTNMITERKTKED